MIEKAKWVAVFALLFAAVAVDFVSSIMSMAFDAAFIGGAAMIMLSLYSNKGES